MRQWAGASEASAIRPAEVELLTQGSLDYKRYFKTPTNSLFRSTRVLPIAIGSRSPRNTAVFLRKVLLQQLFVPVLKYRLLNYRGKNKTTEERNSRTSSGCI